jgi:hypothetical protein
VYLQLGCRAAVGPPPPPKKIEIKEIADFVEMMISNVLLDLPFNRSLPLKSADECIGVLKNKIKT